MRRETRTLNLSGYEAMNARAKVDSILAECGAVLKRARKHEVWGLPNGETFVRSKTPRSEYQSGLDQLHDLGQKLEIVKPAQGRKPTKTRLICAKRNGHSSSEKLKSHVASLSLAESLRMAGITDDALRDRMSELETRMGTIERRQVEIEERLSRCWVCRFQLWYESKF